MAMRASWWQVEGRLLFVVMCVCLTRLLARAFSALGCPFGTAMSPSLWHKWGGGGDLRTQRPAKTGAAVPIPQQRGGRTDKGGFPSPSAPGGCVTSRRAAAGPGTAARRPRCRGRESVGAVRRPLPSPVPVRGRWRRPARSWPGASSTCAETSGWTWARRW